MGNVLRVLKRDFVRLLKAPAALVVVLALFVLPSVYTWYNVLGFWDPYDNTGNLSVCVVNEDEGAETDMTGQLDVGGMIVDELRKNDALNWIEADRESAMDMLASGRVYAVYVIPANFSECLVSPLSGEIERPQLQYYVNEKLGPVSPKITDTGATTLDQTINSMFVSTVSDVAVKAVDDALGQARADLDDTKSRATSRVADALASVQQVRESLQQIEQATGDAQDKAQTARAGLDDASDQIADAAVVLQDVSAQADAVQASLSSISDSTVPTLAAVLAAVSSVTAQSATVADGFIASAGAAQADIQLATSQAQAVADSTARLASELNALADALPEDDPARQDIYDAATRLAERNADLQQRIDDANALGGDAAATSQAVSDAANALNDRAQQAVSSAQGYSDTLFGTTVPAVVSSLGQLSAAASQMSAAISNQSLVVEQAKMSVDQLQSVLGDSQGAVSQTDGLMADLQADLDQVTADVAALSESSAIAQLVSEGKLNAENIADFMGSPTQLETVELYRPNAYGSAMAPLFMNLTFWIGAFMLMVILRQEVDDEGIPNLTLAQRYLARFAMFAIYVIVQSAVCVAGVLLIGVQAANVPALYLASAAASLAYLSVIYMLSVTLRHIGKGLCIVLVFAQIPGASGLYPVELTASFFRGIYPFFPFSYGIDATREAIGGFYGNHFAHDLFGLACFFVVFMLLGLLLQPLMSNVNRMVANQVRESDLFNGEDVVTPARPYRISQVLRALSDRADFHAQITDRYERFQVWYPRLIRGATVVGVGVPVVLVFVLALTTTEKVALLTVFLLWLTGTFVFLVVVESLRYSFERQMRLGAMTDANLVDLFSHRENMVRASTSVTSAEDVDSVIWEIVGDLGDAPATGDGAIGHGATGPDDAGDPDDPDPAPIDVVPLSAASAGEGDGDA